MIRVDWDTIVTVFLLLLLCVAMAALLLLAIYGFESSCTAG